MDFIVRNLGSFYVVLVFQKSICAYKYKKVEALKVQCTRFCTLGIEIWPFYLINFSSGSQLPMINLDFIFLLY